MMLITESRSNSISEFSDTIIISSVLNSIDKNDIQNAMDGLYEKVISRASLFLDFGHHVVAVIVDKFTPEPTSTEMDLQDVAIMEDVRLPFFINRRDQPRWVHYLFLTMPLGMAPLGLLPIGLEHPVEGAVILGAPQRQHLIGVLHIPPGP
jgi:hypothetical protein